VFGRVVGDAVLPAAPDDVDPGSGEDACGVGMVMASRDGLGVQVVGPELAWWESPAKSMTAPRSCLSTAHRKGTTLTFPDCIRRQGGAGQAGESLGVLPCCCLSKLGTRRFGTRLPVAH
jgi:hypothetical protein